MNPYEMHRTAIKDPCPRGSGDEPKSEVYELLKKPLPPRERG